MATLVDQWNGLPTDEARAIADYLIREKLPANRLLMRQALEAIVKQYRTADLHLEVHPGFRTKQCSFIIRERPRMNLIGRYDLANSPLAVGSIVIPDETAQRWIDLADQGV